MCMVCKLPDALKRRTRSPAVKRPAPVAAVAATSTAVKPPDRMMPCSQTTFQACTCLDGAKCTPSRA